MTPPTMDPPLETLLQNPRVMHVLLDMHEGLAQYCEQQEAKGPAASSTIDRYRKLYRKRVGIEYSDRKAVRLKVEEILRAEGGS